MRGQRAVAILCCLLLLVGAGSFVVSPGVSTPKPAEFDRTVDIGMTLEERLALDEQRLVPRAQIAFSQFPYVVGYRGIGLAATATDDPLVRQQFGYPRIVYLEAAPPNVSLDEEGYLVGNHTSEWIPADEAHLVIDSDARIPSGPTPVSFESAADARAFASAVDGSVVGWEDRQRFASTRSNGSTVQSRIDSQAEVADESVERNAELLDRPVETVVGQNGSTLQEAISTAEPATTILLPQGTYEGPVEVDKPLTLVGENATIEGDGTGTVVTVTADGVAIEGVTIVGVGDSLRNPEQAPEADPGQVDRQTEEAYGYSDAAITVDSVDRFLATGVDTDTPASGFVLRDVDRAVIDDVRVNGTDEWVEGFMGVVSIRSPAVVQRSTVIGGRDGVYTHRAEGITIRNNRFEDGRFGVHLMYTSDALVAENCASGQALSGVVIMTDPSGIAIVENVVTDARQGITTSGSDSYIGGNTVTDTQQGISTSAQNSLYTENTVVDNEVGFRAAAIFPTSVVFRNDIADNDRHVRATSGPLRVWSQDGEGNYWSGAAGLDRRYSPTDPVDSRLDRTEAARTLADAPVVRGLRTLRGSVPGMRSESVIDAAPRREPVNATRLEAARSLSADSMSTREVCST